MAGMELDEASRRGDGFVVAVGLVVGVSRHQLGAGRPLRVGMLTLDLFERLAGALGVAAFEQILRLVVELLDRPLDVLLVVRAGAADNDRARHNQGEHRGSNHGGIKRLGAMARRTMSGRTRSLSSRAGPR